MSTINYVAKRPYFHGTGRRKSSIATVKLFPGGNGKMLINGRDAKEYFGLDNLVYIVNRPIETTATSGKFDVEAKIVGGGLSGQAGALCLAISRALMLGDENYRPLLKAAGLTTRDPRMKERKKYGLKAARKRPQFSKR